MKIDSGLQDLDRVKTDFLNGKLSIHRASVAVSNVILNNIPARTSHPSDINEIDRMAKSLSSELELIEFVEMSENHIKKALIVFEKVKEKIIFINQNYPKRAKDFWAN